MKEQIKITTIWWWNWQSNLLDWLNSYFWDDIKISSIVSMSDDWRTTWVLMKAFNDKLNIHLPPPWDVRRCLFSLSKSKYKDLFKMYFEQEITLDWDIKDFSIKDILLSLDSSNDFIEYISREKKDFLDFVIPLDIKIKWHKFWNILMASLFYNYDQNYDKMLDFLHNMMEVWWKIIPVTIKRAYIKAILWNWDVIEKQDNISNVVNYNSWISDLRLMDCSIDAKHTKQVHEAIVESNYLIIWPWDLYTSIISNFIIWGVKDSVNDSISKIIYIWNSTNKWWETTWLTQLDFLNKIELFLWKKVDYFVLNNSKPSLSDDEKEVFKNDISIKWGDYLFLSDIEREELSRRWVNVLETNLLWDNKSYKYDKKKIVETLSKIIFNK